LFLWYVDFDDIMIVHVVDYLAKRLS